MKEILELPRQYYQNRALLPPITSIYFVTDLEQVYYIGKARSLLNRLSHNHHKIKEIPQKEKKYIAYKEVPLASLDEIEQTYIRRYQPKYNDTYKDNNRTERFTFTVSKSEKKYILKMVESSGKDISNWVRRAISLYLKNIKYFEGKMTYIPTAHYNELVAFVSKIAFVDKNSEAIKILNRIFK